MISAKGARELSLKQNRLKYYLDKLNNGITASAEKGRSSYILEWEERISSDTFIFITGKLNKLGYKVKTIVNDAYFPFNAIRVIWDEEGANIYD